jgi:hypothetical protein
MLKSFLYSLSSIRLHRFTAKRLVGAPQTNTASCRAAFSALKAFFVHVYVYRSVQNFLLRPPNPALNRTAYSGRLALR